MGERSLREIKGGETVIERYCMNKDVICSLQWKLKTDEMEENARKLWAQPMLMGRKNYYCQHSILPKAICQHNYKMTFFTEQQKKWHLPSAVISTVASPKAPLDLTLGTLTLPHGAKPQFLHMWVLWYVFWPNSLSFNFL